MATETIFPIPDPYSPPALVAEAALSLVFDAAEIAALAAFTLAVALVAKAFGA